MIKADSNKITDNQDGVKRFFKDNYNSFMEKTARVVEDTTRLAGAKLEPAIVGKYD